MLPSNSDPDWELTTRSYALRADAMYVATAALAESLELESVLDTLLSYLQSLVPYDTASVMLLEDESQLTIRAMRGFEKWLPSDRVDAITQLAPKLKDSPLLQTALEQSVILEDAHAHPDWKRTPEFDYIRNWIGVPLVVEGKAIGVYSLDKATPGFFTRDHLQLAEMMAAPAAAAIRNAHLFAQVQKQKKQLEGRVSRSDKNLVLQYERQAALADIKIALHQPQELQALLDNVIEAVKTLLPSTDASIVLWDKKTETFVSSATTTANMAAEAPARLARTRGGATRWIVDNQRPLLVPDVQFDQFKANKMLEDYGYRAYAGVPLLISDSCLGALYALEAEKRHFREEDVSFLQALANQAAAAIDNVRLFQALRSNEARLNSVISHAPVLLFVLDSNGVITFAKGAALKQISVAPDEMIGRTFQTVFQDFPHAVQNAQKALAGEDVYSTSEVFGSFWAARYVPFFDEIAGANSVIGVATNITEIKKAEQLQQELFEQSQRALTRTEAMYRVAQSLVAVSELKSLLQSIVDNVSEVLPADRTALYILDLAAQQVKDYVVGGPGATGSQKASFPDLLEGLTGWVLRESRPALSVKDQLDPREAPHIQQRRIAYQSGSIVVVPLQFREQMLGTITVIRLPEEPDFDEEDVTLLETIANQAAAAIQTASLYEKVRSHVKELEARVAKRTRALTKANDRLLEVGKLRTRFMHDVSHELRTPLTNFKLYLELLKSGKEEQRDRYLEVLEQTSQRCEHLIEGVLQLSRLEVDKNNLEFDKVDLNLLVEEAIAAHAERAKAAGIALEFEPLVVGDTAVWADASQLKDGLNSLFVNALTYTLEGHVQVKISPDPANDYLLLTISDTGMGIDPEDLPHIFEPFYRGKQVGQSTFAGMGIGLTLLREIIHTHHGEIEVSSEIDRGTAVTLKLPTQPPPSDPD